MIATQYALNLINYLRCRKILYKNKHKIFKYNASICAMAKNEEPYIEEWLDHHISIGVEHIYIIDNNDKPGLKNFLDKYIQSGILTVIDFQNIPPKSQLAAYSYCLSNYAKDSKWMAFIDIDEFINLPIHKNINDFLKEKDNCPAIGVNWLMYGSDGQIYKNKNGVKERFKTPLISHPRNKGIKTIIRCDIFCECNDCVMRVHRWNFPVLSEKGRFILGELSTPTYKLIAIHHYFTKSFEEYYNRSLTGTPSPSSRRIEEFFDYNDRSMEDSINIFLKERQELF